LGSRSSASARRRSHIAGCWPSGSSFSGTCSSAPWPASGSGPPSACGPSSQRPHRREMVQRPGGPAGGARGQTPLGAGPAAAPPVQPDDQRPGPGPGAPRRGPGARRGGARPVPPAAAASPATTSSTSSTSCSGHAAGPPPTGAKKRRAGELKDYDRAAGELHARCWKPSVPSAPGWPRIPHPARLPGAEVPLDVVSASWEPHVRDRDDGSVNRAAYACCVLDRLRVGLRRRYLYVPGSIRWAIHEA